MDLKRVKLEAALAKYLLTNKVKKLQLGCGLNPIEGFFNTDINIIDGVYYVDECQPLPFGAETFHYVFLEHNFEHLSYQEGRALLRECYRILKPNGVLRLTTPCLEFLLDIYQHPETGLHQTYMKWHFEKFAPEMYEDFKEELPPALLISNFLRLWGHKCIYDHTTIKRCLDVAGFKDVKFCEVCKSEHPELQNLEHHQNVIPVQFNALETMCLEATK